VTFRQEKKSGIRGEKKWIFREPIKILIHNPSYPRMKCCRQCIFRLYGVLGK
jgi:hypothetical protein